MCPSRFKNSMLSMRLYYALEAAASSEKHCSFLDRILDALSVDDVLCKELVEELHFVGCAQRGDLGLEVIGVAEEGGTEFLSIHEAVEVFFNLFVNAIVLFFESVLEGFP